MTIYDQYGTLALARLRAQKWLVLLFKPKNFADLMNAIDPMMMPQSEHNFKKVLKDIGIPPEEQDWLWNYLKECHQNTGPGTPGGYDNIPEAATSGW
jgi:hypothetical protein